MPDYLDDFVSDRTCEEQYDDYRYDYDFHETWYDVEIPIVSEYKELTDNTILPDYFVNNCGYVCAIDINFLGLLRTESMDFPFW